MTDPPVADGRQVIIADTDHLGGIGYNDPAWVWKCFARGIHPIYMDAYRNQRRRQQDRIHDPTPDPKWEPMRRAMGNVRRLSLQLDLARLRPVAAVSTPEWCLAEPGRTYIVYQPRGGAVTLDLRDASGERGYRWLDTRTLAVLGGGVLTAGERLTLPAPSPNGVVLHVGRLDEMRGASC